MGKRGCAAEKRLTVKVITIQIGARHRYAVPRLLHEAGHLEALYTDSNGTFGLGRLLGRVPKSILPSAAKRLVQRTISGIPESKVRSTDMLVLWESLLRRVSSSDFDFDLKRDSIFSRSLLRWGLCDADWVYSMFGEGWTFIESAKRQGTKIALDIFVNPITHRIVESERRLFPDWEQPDNADFERLESDLCKRIALADMLLCPANSVVEGLKSYSPFVAEKVRVVPYGFAADARRAAATPIPGRVLFGGTACLRKGIHYLAQAAAIVSSSFPKYAFRVAGAAGANITSKPECARLRFLGALTRRDFLAELEAADLFVLPTLAEGSATAIYEALAMGVPVVTTKSAGSVVTDGREGYIVPERDVSTLVTAIIKITTDRKRRTAMSQEALQTAMEYSEARWGDRIIGALQSVSQT